MISSYNEQMTVSAVNNQRTYYEIFCMAKRSAV